MKKLPIGIESFENIIREDYYYVDKTGLVRDLLNSMSKVVLFTRPRRFGKSLNIDTLKSFFEIGSDASLFDGLDISREKELCEKYQGKFPVISISLKSAEGMCYNKAVLSMSNIIKKEARRHQYLLQSSKLSDIDKEELKQIFIGDLNENVQRFAISLLSEMLYKHYGVRTVILIDEYDVPLDKAYQYGYYNEMVQHIRIMFGEALKTNSYLEFAVLTGCMRVSKESIFTGLNNFETRSFSDTAFTEYFGFTDNEVVDMLKYYGQEEKAGLFKKWYDGYHFGNNDIYCPWSIINQCKRFCEAEEDMQSYWINSSGNSIIKDMAKRASDETREHMESLVLGETVRQKIIPEMTYQDIDETDGELQQAYLWSLLYVAGYLTDARKPAGGVHTLAIPNLEVYMVYERQVLSWFKTGIRSRQQELEQFFMAIKNCDQEQIAVLIEKFLSSLVSIRDTCYRKDLKENFYHGFLLMALGLDKDWIVMSNRESGTGYPDIMVLDEKTSTGWIFELKYAEKGKMENACKNALKQAEDNDYAALLRQEGISDIYLLGIAFYQKSCKVIYKKAVMR